MAAFNIIKGIRVFEYGIAILMFYKTIYDNKNIIYIKFRSNCVLQPISFASNDNTGSLKMNKVNA